MSAVTNPTVFISYSWDNEIHKSWVRDLATRLRGDGIDIILDQWETAPGDQLPVFMERAVRNNDYVVVVCTPNYKKRSDNREGGVGYEGDIMTAEVLINRPHRKFIPILRHGTWAQAAPSWLSGRYYVDFRGNPYSELGYDDLLATIYGTRPTAPPLGPIPEKFITRTNENSEVETPIPESTGEIRIRGIVVDEVTEPTMEGSRGSTLYRIPFQLSETPSTEWVSLFVEVWNHPPIFTGMHRPGIARVRGDRVILDGTTIEEVKEYHRDTLVLVVKRVNEMIAEHNVQRHRERELRQSQSSEHRKNIEDMSKRIKFD
jgi:hypothetical protein